MIYDGLKYELHKISFFKQFFSIGHKIADFKEGATNLRTLVPLNPRKEGKQPLPLITCSGYGLCRVLMKLFHLMDIR